MARIDSDWFIWVKDPTITPNYDVQITHAGNTVSYKDRVWKLQWKEVATVAIGSFSVTLKNIDGVLSNFFVAGDIVKIYADYGTGTVLQLTGFIDYPQESYTVDGNSIIITGRHLSLPLMSKNVTYSATNRAKHLILIDIATQFATGFNTTYVETTTATYSPSWTDKPFTDCLTELCGSTHDSYFDDTYGIHFFAKYSKNNDTEACVHGDTMLDISAFGADSTYQKNKIIAYGTTPTGSPIVYTVGTGTTEYILQTTATTLQGVIDAANAELAKQNVSPNVGKFKDRGHTYLYPGDMMWVSIPTMQIQGRQRVLDITHQIDKDGWYSIITLEKERKDISVFLKEQQTSIKTLSTETNPYAMRYSLPLEFDGTETLTLSGTQLVSGKLALATGNASGTVTTQTIATTTPITQIYLVALGGQLDISTFQVSFDGGNTWSNIVFGLNTVTGSTSAILRITLNSSAVYTYPYIDSLSMMYNIA